MALTQWFPTPVFARIFMLCFLGWGVIELLNHLLGKWQRLAELKATKDRGSYWLLVVMTYLSFCLAYAGRFFDLGVLTGSVQYGGLALMLGGLVLREWAILALGRHFSVVVAIESDHQLVTRPPYRWLRHPAYSGALLAMIGFHLALGGWGSALLASAILIPAFVYRSRLEEWLLLKIFGDEYRRYMRRTWRFFPGW